jgi:arylsulfatase A-like enzyme
MNSRSKVVLILLSVLGIAGIAAVATFFFSPARIARVRGSELPNILLITLDTTRADHLSCYGYARKTTPRIDELAGESMLHTRCISTSSWTLPAHASLLTGRFPTSHGAKYDPNGPVALTGILPGEWAGYRVNALSREVESLATILKRVGYATGAVVGGPWLKKAFGLDQGFDTYDDDEITDVNGRPAELINRRAEPWVDKTADRAFLLFLNYFDPHDPYQPPKEFRFRFLDRSKLVNGAKATPYELMAFYDAEIYYADHFVGKLIDHLKDVGLYDDTWIIITADHGELFGEHGMRGHGLTLWEEELHVPLIMKYPKRWARQGRSSEPIQLIDIMPMILDRLGFSMPAGMQGIVSGRGAHPIFAEVNPLAAISALGDYRAFYQDNLKYIWNSRGHHTLFDLRADPREEKNLYASELDKAMALRTAMDELLAGLPRPGQAAPVTSVDQRTLDALRGLGYIPPSKVASRPATSTSPAGQR